MKFELKDIKMISENQRQMPVKIGKSFRLISTKEYREYKQLLTDYFTLNAPKTPILGNFYAKLIVHTYKDLTNITKAIFDALEKSGHIKNDRFLLDCHLIKIPVKRGQPDSFFLEIWE